MSNEKLQSKACEGKDVLMEIVEVDKKPYVCYECSEAFMLLDSLVAHKNEHRNEHFFVCADCNSIFTVEDDLNKHLKTHNAPEALLNDVQSESYDFKTVLNSKFFIPNSDLGFDEPAELSFKLQSGTLKRENEMHLGTQPTAAVAIHPRLRQLHQCNKCGKSFLRRYQLTCHKILHKYSRFRCMPSNCSKATLYGNHHISIDCKPIQEDQHKKPLTKKCIFGKHLELYRDQQYSKSIQCAKEVRWKSYLKKGETPHQCDECVRTFKQKSHLIDYPRAHTEKKCNQCDGSFLHKTDFRHHLRLQGRERPFRCDECDKAFGQKHHLKQHMRTHSEEKPFQCDQCDKSFAWKRDLGRHFRTHSGEKPYQCDQCDKAFAWKRDLGRHFRTHSGEKPYQCDQCDKAFAQKSDLTGHYRTHSGERPYQCDKCAKAFTKKFNLSRHRKACIGDGSYKFNQREEAISYKYTLKEDMKTRHDQKPNRCQVCNKTFAKKDHLNKHIMTHSSKPQVHNKFYTGEEPCQCDPFDEEFREKMSLACHHKKYNGEKKYPCDQFSKDCNEKTASPDFQKLHDKKNWFFI